MITVPPPASPPQNTVQAVSRGFESVLHNLRDNPALIVVVVLNVIGIGAALWFLQSLIALNRANFDQIIKLCGMAPP